MLVGQFGHPVGQGGGEEHAEALAGGWQAPQQVADVLDEAQVEHAIGLVDHHHLGHPQVKDPLFEVVDEPARGANEDIDPGGHLVTLLKITGAAVDQTQANATMGGQLLGVPVDLHRQLAGRRHEQGPRLVGLALGRGGLGQEAMQGGHHKGRRFTRARLGLTRHVMAGQGDGQGLGLDGRAVVKTRVRQALEDAGVEIKARESDVGKVCLGHENRGLTGPNDWLPVERLANFWNLG